MKRVLTFLSVLLMPLCLAPTALAAHLHLAPHSAWKLNVAKSEFGGGPAMKSDRFVILTDTSKWLKFSVVEVRGDGTTSKFTWSGPQDGTMHPTAGVPGQMASFKEADDSFHMEAPDGTVMDSHYDLSANNKIFTQHVTVKTKDGHEYHQTWVYDRVK